jgi:PilZ domain
MLPPLINKIALLMQKRPRVERRGAKRLSPNALTPCQIRPAGGDKQYAAWIHNLSKTGVGLLTSAEMPAGTHLQILIVNAAHTAALTSEVKIVRCTRVVSRDFLLGGEFINALQHDEMVPFIL